MLLVTRASGIVDYFCADKITLFLREHSKDLENIDTNKILVFLRLELDKKNISTSQLLESLIRICNNLASEESPDYQMLGGRVKKYSVYKAIYGKGKAPRSIRETLEIGYERKVYAPLKNYDEQDFAYLEKFIDHDRDNNISLAGWFALEDKYLLSNVSTGECIETPQIMYMLISMYGFENCENKSIHSVAKMYEYISTNKLNLPTPLLASLRTFRSQPSSCVLMEMGDSIESISRAIENIVICTAHRAGIGITVGAMRAIGSDINKGTMKHSGSIPYIKLIEAAVNSTTQSKVRKGACTVFFQIWHMEIEELVTLKNNRGSEANRARHLDYCVQISKLFYERLIKGENISLFSTSETPGLYDAFFKGEEEFKKLYLKYEADPNVRRKTVNSLDLFRKIMIERSQTGRIYIQNVDHCNNYSTFNEKAPAIKGSNLCLEVLLPTTPISSKDDFELPLCTLAALNIGKIHESEMEEICNVLVRFFDNIIDNQHYPIAAAKKTHQKRRSLGIGVTNLAYMLAKNKLKYGDMEARNLVHRTMENIQYNLLLASCQLAKEKGPCSAYSETTFSQGVLSIDLYKKNIDSHHSQALLKDWDGLREQIAKYGVRHSTLSCIMPCESSSLVSNSTNGIEPPLSPISSKQSKSHPVNFVVGDYLELKDYYTFRWDLKNEDYLILCGIMQKFIDQTISTNTNYNPNLYKDNMVSLHEIIKDVLFAYKIGIKTLYYHNTKDNIEEIGDDCGCKI